MLAIMIIRPNYPSRYINRNTTPEQPTNEHSDSLERILIIYWILPSNSLLHHLRGASCVASATMAYSSALEMMPIALATSTSTFSVRLSWKKVSKRCMCFFLCLARWEEDSNGIDRPHSGYHRRYLRRGVHTEWPHRIGGHLNMPSENILPSSTATLHQKID